MSADLEARIKELEEQLQDAQDDNEMNLAQIEEITTMY